MEEVVIRLLQEGDIDQINTLHNNSYHTERTTEKFKWEYQRGPAGPAIYVVAVDSRLNRVVGTQCAIPLQVVSGSQNVLTAKSEDTLLDPKYRGQKIFERMYSLLFDECRKAGIQTIWGFTYAVEPFAKLGFEIPFHSNFGLVAFRLAEPYRYLIGLKAGRSIFEKVKIAGLVVASRLKYATYGRSSSLKGFTVSNDIQTDLESLTQRNELFHLQQDRKFLDWRVRENPYPVGHSYYSLIDSTGTGKRRASIVCSHHGADLTYIMQMIFDQDLPAKAKEGFLRAIVTDLSGKTGLLRFWGFSHNVLGQEEINLLSKAGFIFTNQGISFVWIKLAKDCTLNPMNFALSRMAAQGT